MNGILCVALMVGADSAKIVTAIQGRGQKGWKGYESGSCKSKSGGTGRDRQEASEVQHYIVSINISF